MPLKNGYSKATIKNNISVLTRDGLPKKQAVAISFKQARAAWKKKQPRKQSPDYLRKNNPDWIFAPKRKRATVKHKIKTRPKVRRTKNPVSWIIHALNIKTNKHGYFSGETIDSDLSKARHYKTAMSAGKVAVQLAKVLPANWKVITLYEYKTRGKR